MQRLPEFRTIVSIWLCILALFGAFLVAFPLMTADIARFDRYGFDARFHELLKAGDVGAALHESLLALALDARDVEARYALGEALERSGDVASASEEFKRAARLIDRHQFVNAKDRSREYRFWFRYHVARGEWFDALAAFCLLPEDEASQVPAEMRADVVAAAAEARWWGAVAELYDEESVETMMPDDGPACTQFAQACLNAGKTQLAEMAFDCAVERGSEIAAFHAGLIALGRGDDREAEALFERAPAGFREYGLGRVLRMRGELVQANELYKRALEVRGSDIEWLCDAFEAAQQVGDTEQAKRVVAIVQQLKPTFRKRYRINLQLILRGLAMDTSWLSRNGYVIATFFWHVARSRSPEELVVVERDARNVVARAGRLFLHKTTARNLLLEPGCETGPRGRRYPLGFAEVQGGSSTSGQCRVVADEEPDHGGDQCLLLSGTKERPTSCIDSRRLKVSGGAYYMLGGNLRTRGGNAEMLCRWFDASDREVPIKPTLIRVRDYTQWITKSKVIRAPHSATTCIVQIRNRRSEGESFFDDVFLIEIPIEQSILSVL